VEELLSQFRHALFTAAPWLGQIRADKTAPGIGIQIQFVKGPWKAGYPLGTYGVDASAKTAWAVIDYNGDFAVAASIELPPDRR
jgi:hypothetical protein